MATALYGQVREYIEGEEEWSQYVEQVEYFWLLTELKMQVRNASFPLSAWSSTLQVATEFNSAGKKRREVI